MNAQMMSDLVSVIVVSFNSSSFVLHTLNSVFNQTYRHIELIISDDSSSDNTINLVEDWITNHANRFVSVKITQSSINKGTACNINRGLQYAHGTWIMPLAADDVLKTNYLQEMLEFFHSNNEIKIAYSNVEYIDSKGNLISQRSKYYSKFNLNTTDSNLQHKVLLRYNPVFSPSLIFNRSIIDNYGMFDERFPLCEDLFFLIKITGKGEKIYYNPTILLQYRLHQSSIQQKTKEILRKYDFDYYNGLHEYALSFYSALERSLFNFVWKELQLFSRIYDNKNTLWAKLSISMTTLVPHFILRIIRFKYYLAIKPRRGVEKPNDKSCSN